MHNWYWQTWNDLPFLTCDILQGFPHGFFTQQFWSRSPTDLVIVLHPTAKAYRTQQVHGDIVLSPSEIERYQAAIATHAESTATFPTPTHSPAADSSSSDSLAQGSPANGSPTDNSPFAAGDGLITEQGDQAVWVCSADCTPVLIADAKTGQVSAIHAGWRGTAAKIVPKAIARLQAQGSQLKNLRIAMGPAIAGEVYQVANAVAAQVGATIISENLPEAEQLATLKQLPNPPILSDDRPEHVRLDVRRINALQLEQLGIVPEQVAIAPYCTYQTPEHFFSYRRDRQKKVQWSGIVSQC